MAMRPILFSGPMIRALLAGTKTQTRRPLRVQPSANTVQVSTFHHPDPRPMFYAWVRDGGPTADHPTAGAEISEWPPGPCPYGQPGDWLWVRETFAKIDGQTQAWIETDYRATYTHGDRLGDALGIKKRWTPAIHMPREASRITLQVIDVRVERLQEISEADALAEGVFRKIGSSRVGDVVETASGGELIYAAPTQAREEYRRLWEQINGAGSWSTNPWVWVLSFTVTRRAA